VDLGSTAQAWGFESLQVHHLKTPRNPNPETG